MSASARSAALLSGWGWRWEEKSVGALRSKLVREPTEPLKAGSTPTVSMVTQQLRQLQQG